MYSQSARYYDAIYAFKDYAEESARLHALIQDHKRSEGRRLLDVACGTGNHITHLVDDFEVEGIDLDPQMLEIARRKNPDVLFHLGDMLDFQLDRSFDVVACLFSSIGYVKTLSKLHQAIGNMARHLCAGGVLVVEPWFSPQVYQPGTVHAAFVDEPELKIARINLSLAEDSLSLFDMHYLIGTPQGVEHFVERHELGLFEESDYKDAFRKAGLDPIYNLDGLSGRGLYLGVQESA